MTKEMKFIDLFNQLDQYFRLKYFNHNPKYMSYTSKIYYIRKHKLEPILSNDQNFDCLKKAGEIRNIIAHNNDVIVPSDNFFNQFQSLVERIIAPLRADQIMTPFSRLKTATLDTRLDQMIHLLKSTGFGSIPIMKNHELVGLFTEKTVFDYLTISDRIIDKDMRLKDMIEVIDLDQKPRAYFDFIGRDMSIDDAYQIYTDDFKKNHELIVLLVTEHGIDTEKLLGIVTLRDIKNHMNQ
jgi:CBS domain-containing protein